LEDRDGEMLEVFEEHTHCGMDKNSKSIYAHEITVMHNELIHNFGLKYTLAEQ
jgi:hypothetical protein